MSKFLYITGIYLVATLMACETSEPVTSRTQSSDVANSGDATVDPVTFEITQPSKADLNKIQAGLADKVKTVGVRIFVKKGSCTLQGSDIKKIGPYEEGKPLIYSLIRGCDYVLHVEFGEGTYEAKTALADDDAITLPDVALLAKIYAEYPAGTLKKDSYAKDKSVKFSNIGAGLSLKP